MYCRYGGSGIGVCARWKESFASFLEDMGERPSGTTIDRIKNSGGYWCGHCEECLNNGWTSNCRWATDEEQLANRDFKTVEIDGVSRTIAQWAKQPGAISRSIIVRRLKKGWPLKLAVFTPQRPSYPPRVFEGMTFRDWTTINKIGDSLGHGEFWFCECSCGTKKRVATKHLLQGRSQSCGHKRRSKDVQ
jgi:hypothetical protein